MLLRAQVRARLLERAPLVNPARRKGVADTGTEPSGTARSIFGNGGLSVRRSAETDANARGPSPTAAVVGPRRTRSYVNWKIAVVAVA